jgi:hypothetical protein
MPPKNHKNRKAVGATTKALGKALAKKEAKPPFTKPRKVPSLNTKSEAWI